MRRCTACFRFHPGRPTYCSFCGRSFDVRICNRGHENARGAHFCSICGSAELSTPAPHASFLHRLSGAVLYGFVIFTAITVCLLLVLAVIRTIEWQAISGSILSLLLMLGILYWTTTLLPGPVKKLATKVGRGVWGSKRNSRRKHDH